MFNEADDEVFLRGQAFGDKQGEGDQGVVGDELLHRLAEQGRVHQRKRKAPLRLLPSASGWFLMTK